jgi:hypothetical protein
MTNVPVYAFAFGLLGFGTFLTSASYVEKFFFDKLKWAACGSPLVRYFFLLFFGA